MTKGGIYLVVTVDTEADHDGNWYKSRPLTFNSVIDAIPNTIEPLFKRHGAVGTYMLAVEVLEDDRTLAAIKSLKAPYELGVHLHPDYVGPAKRYSEYSGTYSKEFSNNYSPDIEKEKLRTITTLFQERLGYAPKVYRGGKFGFGQTTAEALMELGYLVDTSITPNVSWKGLGGPDFTRCPEQPYLIKSPDGNKRLVEVPISISFISRFDRLFKRPTWLRPSFAKPGMMKALIDNLIARYKDKGAVVLNMMFHNVEFYPSASPYAADQDSCDRLLSRMEETIMYCRDIGTKFVKLSEINDIFKD